MSTTCVTGVVFEVTENLPLKENEPLSVSRIPQKCNKDENCFNLFYGFCQVMQAAASIS
jgi:hypothetical protein